MVHLIDPINHRSTSRMDDTFTQIFNSGNCNVVSMILGAFQHVKVKEQVTKYCLLVCRWFPSSCGTSTTYLHIAISKNISSTTAIEAMCLSNCIFCECATTLCTTTFCAREGKLLIPTYLLTYLPHIDAKATVSQMERRFWYLLGT